MSWRGVADGTADVGESLMFRLQDDGRIVSGASSELCSSTSANTMTRGSPNAIPAQAAGKGMAVGSFTTGMTLTGSGLSIERLYGAAGLTLPPTPGRVGVCLSGGGSRALAAGMGKLRALKQLTANGAPVLGQVRALSTVSGGSWLGVPFIFLPPPPQAMTPTSVRMSRIKVPSHRTTCSPACR
jgi:hypothetical protein